MKKCKIALIVFMLFLPAATATTIVIGNPIVANAQSDGTGSYEEYIWKNIPAKYRKQYDALQKKHGKCVARAIYNAVAFNGFTWQAALQAVNNAGSCTIFG